MSYFVLTIGGKAGFETRDELHETLNTFHTIYGVQPTRMTVTAAWLATFRRMLSSIELDFAGAEKALLAGDSIKFFGVDLRLGPAYTVGN